ncbi:MAG: Flp family type IVb pilin [Bdellovibrio sp.]|nr:Flp family type IVb pilin [Bdellovibrio sp.]
MSKIKTTKVQLPRKLNNKGQGMIEYMILVALIAVGTIGVVKVVGQNVTKQYENINRAMGAKKTEKLDLDNVSNTNRKDLSNFMDGAR